MTRPGCEGLAPGFGWVTDGRYRPNVSTGAGSGNAAAPARGQHLGSMIRPARHVALLLLLALRPWVLVAQDSAPIPAKQMPTLQGLSLGGTVDRYLVGDEPYTAVSFRGLALKPAGWGAEFAFGLLPDVDSYNRAALVMDLGTAYGICLPGSLLLLKAGSTGIFELSQSGALLGAYGGVGLVAPLAGGVGLRVEATRRWYLAFGEQPEVWVLSVGLTSIPLRR